MLVDHQQTCRQAHQTFGLVIGIDEYKSTTPNQDLKGAVRDANDFNSYLLRDLGVPGANIVNLRNEQATRAAIIEQFRTLEHHPRITKDNPILIYFAGHGAVAHKPDAWANWVTADRRVEMLCPTDINARDANKKPIEGIPDRTISRLLLDLSIAKGNNITLILDCCHAAGINRGLGNSGRSRARNFETVQDLSQTCDEDIYSHEYPTGMVQDDAPGLSNSLFGSHVLLAACNRNHTAREEDGEGIFTTAFLESLRCYTSRDSLPTYDLLMKDLSRTLTNQVPHWGGKHVHRRLFDPREEHSGGHMILCYKEEAGQLWSSDLVLYAGSLHGITENSIFEIFKSDSHIPYLKDVLATSKVTEVQAHISRLAHLSDSAFFDSNSEQRYWYARLQQAVGPPQLNTFCDDKGVLDQILDENAESRLAASVTRAKNPDEADLCLMVEERNVRFNRGKRFNTRTGFSHFPHHPPCPIDSVADIRNFIDRYAHFTSHLTMKSQAAVEKFVRIEMNKLHRVGNDLQPKSKVALTKGENGELVAEVIVDMSLPLKGRDAYGFTIYGCNDNLSLYVYLLYFDASKYIIEPWYASQMGPIHEEVSVDPCIINHSKLTIGYGQNRDPIVFNIPDRQNVDVCFFKVLVITIAVDIGPIVRPVSPARTREAVRLPKSLLFSDFDWASKTITIVSKRAQSAKENVPTMPEESKT
ncbi:uncharacterized protein ARMOST_11361 [Armillaria ostoyae]|uniref:Peptidase C14 caspase domain-containing protein n=1 Tax=Armillaria ostoyae TaxID=47428 RepID=A0A284RGY0_ARMOS|nr:uncharacterized protein ARMOST_11361 [Armillaria ostoyae]